ncbi:MAG: hypothetical protein HOH43_17970 [Candidatus Latescibacteria bacterium]|nr:hypothetical protein [Candidatus Latescibacterota bacterium]
MSVLSATQMAFWEENGYVVIPDSVPLYQLNAVVDEIWQFLGMDPNDQNDWYREPHRPGGMVEMYQTQGLWNNRQSTKIYQAFTEIWGTEKLWVSMDRANMKPPVRSDKPDWDHPGMIHWDMDTTGLTSVTTRVQGVLYLTDTGTDQGGFQCVPGFHRRFLDWVNTQPEDRDPNRPDLNGLDVTSIPGNAGDFLIWHSLLPHGNGRNTSDLPRLAQYISMSPAVSPTEEAREQRIRMWRERLHPQGTAFPGDDRRLETDNPPANLSTLGRNLLGLDLWGRDD